ncbi:unnamed protein product [Caenorhabditis auriculariae]|uniref:Uncharacterized protein n=1 Tax=Caenorhabditis auriculariae TaxID=2777116 RepID=A0A8S1H2M3_9PELO|nr:unnamed protein product [Caenorhabditis auriculariae]
MSSTNKKIFYTAAEEGLSELESLVKKEPQSLKEVDHRGRNALFYAAMTDNLKNAQFLIKKGLSPSDVDSYQATPLHWATRCDSYKVARHLISLEKGKEQVLRKEKDQMFLELLSEEKDLYDKTKDRRGRSPLHYAACSVNIDAVKAILDAKLGYPIDQKDIYGVTPLMCAVCVALPQTPAVVRFLIKRKPPSREARNKDGQTALHLAVASQNVAMVKLLVEELECQLEAPDEESRTPLHYAAEQGFDEIVTVLLNNGARNSTRDKFGVTPAHYAAQFSVKCLDLLLTRSHITEVKDDQNRTCLMWAAVAGNVDAIHYLIQRKEAPDRHATDKYGYTALHLAAMAGNENVCKILVNQGWSISERDKSNNTALHLAVGRGYTEIVRFLVTSGANMNERDAVDRTPVFWACLGGQSHTLHCMIKELGFEWRTGGKDQRPITDALGRTPLHAAAFSGFSACINVLLNIEEEDDCLKSPLVGWRDHEGDP